MENNEELKLCFVNVVGMEEDLFPSAMSMSTRSELEEERRLFYVGMTRAKKKLVLAYVKRQYEKEREPSRFLEETGL